MACPTGPASPWGDYDGNGRTDIYLGSVQGPNALYRNLGDWRFEEVAAAVGADLPDRITRGVVFADVDGDGDMDLLDLYVVNYKRKYARDLFPPSVRTQEAFERRPVPGGLFNGRRLPGRDGPAPRAGAG